MAALGLLLGALGAVPAMLAQLGRVSPRWDVLTHLAPAYLLAALAAGAIAPAIGGGARRITMGLALLGVIASAALIAPEFLRSAGPVAAADAPGQVKVIEFNVWEGNRNLPAVADWLAAQHPDVIILEESSPILRDLIKARLGWTGVAGRLSSTMVLTPKPFVTMNRLEGQRGWRLTWVNATYASGSGPMEVVATHFDRPTGRLQPVQSLALRQVLATLPRDRLILAGDFNSTPWSFARRADDKAFGLTRRDRALATWPAHYRGRRFPFPFMPIDHLYAGPGWATVKVERGPSLGSDHYPLVVTLAPVSPDARYPGNPGR